VGKALQPVSRRDASVVGAGAGERWLALVPPVTVGLFILPLAAGLAGTLLPAFGFLPAIGGDRLDLEPWRTMLRHPGAGTAILTTLWIGWSATLASVAIAALAAAALHGTRAARAMRTLMTPVLAAPHAAMAIGLAFVIAPSGWLARLVSPWPSGWQVPPDVATVGGANGLAVIGGLLIKEVPYVLLMIGAALAQTQAARQLDAARALGYPRATAWLKVVGPQVYAQVRLPVCAVLAYSLATVDVALVLGPSTPPPLSVLALRWFGDPDVGMQFPASAAATLQLLLVGASLLAWFALERGVAAVGRRWIARGRRATGWSLAARLGAALAWLGAIASLAAIAAMALWSVAESWRFPAALPAGWTLDTWSRRLDGFGPLVAETVAIGGAATGVALLLSIGCLEAEHRLGLRTGPRSTWLLYTPLLIPQISFLFGAQVALVRLGLDGRWLAVVWIHLLFVLPYVFLSLADPWRALDRRLLRSAAALGAGPWRTLVAVKLPVLLKPLSVAAAVGFAVSVAQYLPTLFAGNGRIATLTTEALTLAAGADRRVIGAYAFVQAALPFAAYLLAAGLPAWVHRDRKALRDA
jgi:putative thiamine transport system permease protein